MCEIKDCFIIETGYWINKDKNIFKRKDFLPHLLLKSTILKRNNYGIFQTTFRYDTENQDEAFLYGDFYLDFDSDNFEHARKDVLKAISYFKIVFNLKNPTKQLQIYFSGNKGFHITIPAEILGIKPRKDLNEIYKTIANAISQYTEFNTIDLKIYDNKRLFRIPNSKHEKTNLYKTPITLDELRHYSELEIKNIAKTPRLSFIHDLDKKPCIQACNMFETFIERTQIRVNDFKNIKSNGTLKYTPPCILQILEEGAKNGQRNNTIAILSSFFKSSGKDLSETISILEKWNIEKSSYPISESELKRTTRSIYNTQKNFGCSSIKSLGLCNKKDCKFNK